MTPSVYIYIYFRKIGLEQGKEYISFNERRIVYFFGGGCKKFVLHKVKNISRLMNDP